LRAIKENPVIALSVLVPAFWEIWVFVCQLLIFEMRQLPFALAECVVSLCVFLEQRQRDLLPEPDFLKGVADKLFSGDKNLIPTLV
jgi:hypothetical protein